MQYRYIIIVIVNLSTYIIYAGCRGDSVAVYSFDDAEQELWDVLSSNPALHP